MKARGEHYFQASGYPVTAVRVHVQGRHRASHPFDLTEVEHDHDFAELVLVVRGQAMQRLEGEDYPVATGDVYILQSRSRHHFYDIRELELINVMYDQRRLPLPLDELRKLPGYSALFLLEPHYRKRHRFSSKLHLDPGALAVAAGIGSGMVDEVQRGEPGRGAILLAKLLELMTFLARQYGRTKTTHGRELLRIGDVIGRMEREFEHPWTIGELCRLAGMSRSTFLRTFQRALGQPPVDYLIRRRVGAAMQLLLDTDRSITDIALGTGFSDSNYFARQFRRIAGTTPTQYRRSSPRPFQMKQQGTPTWNTVKQPGLHHPTNP